jgi:hypothetical protein
LLNYPGSCYCLKKIEETPHYLYLNGDKRYYREFLSRCYKSRTTNSYDSLISNINSEKICNEKINNITIDISYNTNINKYIILNGIHRTSIYKNNNINYIKCNLKSKTSENHIFKDKIRYEHEHYFEFEQIMNDLEVNNIRYVIIRGFKKLPLTPDTDLDIVCHPDDLNKLKEIMSTRLCLMRKKIIEINSKKVNYLQYKTTNIPNKNIKNTYFHIDIYDDVFFFYKEKICLTNLLDKLFDNRIKHMKKLYIPSPEFEYFLLILRICFDVNRIKPKHKNRLKELIPNVKNEHDLFSYLNNAEKEFLISKINDLSVPIVKNYPVIKYGY